MKFSPTKHKNVGPRSQEDQSKRQILPPAISEASQCASYGCSIRQCFLIPPYMKQYHTVNGKKKLHISIIYEKQGRWKYILSLLAIPAFVTWIGNPRCQVSMYYIMSHRSTDTSFGMPYPLCHFIIFQKLLVPACCTCTVSCHPSSEVAIHHSEYGLYRKWNS